MEGDRYLNDESLWFKVNPSIKNGLPGYGYVRKQVAEAKGIPSKMASVKRLNFCVWVESSNPWIDSETWFTCADPSFDESMLYGRRCWGGMDLSRTLDLTALVLVWEPSESDPFWRMKSYFWIPGDEIMTRREVDHVPYDVWRDKGWLFAPPFKFIKRSYIARFIQDIDRKYELEGVGCDPAMMNEFYADAITEGVDLCEGKWNKDERIWEFPNIDGIKIMPISQQPKSMHPAIEKTESMLVSQVIRHDGNPCLTWCCANAVVDDSDNYRKLSKKRSTGRIDGAVAMVIACQVADVKAADKKRLGLVYKVIKEPHITERATDLITQNKYIFKVYPSANKDKIKRAVEALYQVKVEKVHIIHNPAKRRRLGKSEGWKSGLSKGFKKAIVTLSKGEKIELMPR